MNPPPQPVTYVCGGCGEESTMKQAMKQGDFIQCPQCSYRVLYKKRTRRIVQHEAR